MHPHFADGARLGLAHVFPRDVVAPQQSQHDERTLLLRLR